MFLLFCMIYLIPGDPASVALGPRATEAMKEALRTWLWISIAVSARIVSRSTALTAG